MFWDLVYEFFVKYIFGGYYQNTLYNAKISFFQWSTEDEEFFVQSANTGRLGFYLGDNWSNLNGYIFGHEYFSPVYMPLGNYFSLIATIITMVAILLFCVFIIKKIIGIVFRLFTGSSAF